jgi:predicted O-methyltransferase YrrM
MLKPEDGARPGDTPWYTMDAIGFLDRYINQEVKILEFGSGRSTIWLSKRTKHITSVETDNKWYQWVKFNAPSIDIRLVSSLQEHIDVCNQFNDEYFDLVMLDGDNDFRVDCAIATIPKIKRGGYLLLDNAERAFYWPLIKKSNINYTKILELTDGWELNFSNEKPVKQHGNWYTVWWQKP